jgi:hypothetical protein
VDTLLAHSNTILDWNCDDGWIINFGRKSVFVYIYIYGQNTENEHRLNFDANTCRCVYSNKHKVPSIGNNTFRVAFTASILYM